MGIEHLAGVETDATSESENVVTFSLDDRGGSTAVSIDQGVFATEERRALHGQGWTESLERLQELVSRLESSGLEEQR